MSSMDAVISTMRRDPTATRRAALLHGRDLHHLDHLAPLCSLLDIPLVLTNSSLSLLAASFYPQLSLITLGEEEVAPLLSKQYDLIYSCLPRALLEELFFLPIHLEGYPLRTIWCPHGNSDKGRITPWMEALKEEKSLLLYGEKMADFLIEKGALSPYQEICFTGNMRRSFYEKNREWYDALLDALWPGGKGYRGRCLLYAPTWKDSENSSSFCDMIPRLLDALPPSYALILQLHPHLSLQYPSLVEELWSRYRGDSHILCLRNFTPIYPLLQRADLYLGDMSSVGYDFLSLDRPMFFLNPHRRDLRNDRALYLYQCGVEIPTGEYKNPFVFIERFFEQSHLSEIRRKVYAYTFGKEREEEALREQLCKMR